MISMEDIAREAGVSKTTVSLSLNDRYIDGVIISETTRRKVKEVASRLNYHTNAIARSMATGKSRLIGCLGLDACEDMNPALYLGNILTGAVKEATSMNYSLKLLSSDSEASAIADEAMSYRMSGMIIRSRNPQTIQILKTSLDEQSTPIILLDTDYKSENGVSAVNTDDQDGMKQVMTHLVSNGHKRIIFMAFDDFLPFTCERRSGFLKAASELGVPLSQKDCYSTDSADTRHPFERIEQLTTDILSSSERPSAIVCNCDEVASLVLRSAWRKGIKVPEELSVSGFGNLPQSIFTCPALSTVKRPYAEMGAKAISMLLNPPETPLYAKLPVKFEIRQSSGPAPVN